MSFSFCLNRDEVLLLAGFGLLYQTLEFDRKGKLIQDSQRLLCSVTSILERNGAVGAAEFKKVTCATISIDQLSKSGPATEATDPRRKSDGIMNAPKSIVKAPRRPSAIASTPLVKQEVISGRRATAPTLSLAAWPEHARKNSQQSLSSVFSGSSSKYRKSKPKTTIDSRSQMPDSSLPNLDFLDFSKDRRSIFESTPATPANNVPKASHDGFVGCGMFSQTQPSSNNVFSSPDLFSSTMSPSPAVDFDWASDLWTVPLKNRVPASRSVLSFSEEELTSGEEMSSCDMNGTYSGIKIPQENPPVEMDNLDGSFAL